MLRILLAVSAIALATPAMAQMAAPTPYSTPYSATAIGWTMEKDTGTCVLRKGGDGEPQLAITNRGRFMVSDPNLSDAAFVEGQKTPITLRWADAQSLGDRVEATEAATIILPGGGAQHLKARKAYIIPYDTLALARHYAGGAGGASGFVLTVERDGQPLWTMDTTGSGPAMQALIDCADSVMIKQVQQPAATGKKKRK